ncbi:MAG: LemA family protein [Bacteroidota bacterium]
MITGIVCGALALLVIIAVLYFNKFTKFRNNIKSAWSDIDVQLKRRFDLVPNLVEVVKGYATHEKTLFENISSTRSMALAPGNINESAQANTLLTGQLRNLFAVVENYPNLLANENFIKLQENLVEIEDTLQMARRYYNAVVRDNNTAVQSFPGLVFAGIYGFKTAEFFETEPLEKEVIRVKLN